MRFRYYCIFRPPMLGAVPRGFVEMEDYGERKRIDEIGWMAWGWVEYDHPLSKGEISGYELVPQP